MKLGIGTYTYMWSIGFPGAMPPAPMDALGLLAKAHELGVNVVQFGPNLPLCDSSPEVRAVIARSALEKQIEIEIGTRGLEISHLRDQLNLASSLGCRLLRTVPEYPDGDVPSCNAIMECLRGVLPELQARGIRLALENGNMPAEHLAGIIEALESNWIGVTLDTVNSMAIPEGTREVVRTLARHTMCFHVKDFIVQRAWHRMGFIVEGCPAGQGQMDLPWILQQLNAAEVEANAILELWPPELDSIQATIALERRWAEESITYLRRHI